MKSIFLGLVLGFTVTSSFAGEFLCKSKADALAHLRFVVKTEGSSVRELSITTDDAESMGDYKLSKSEFQRTGVNVSAFQNAPQSESVQLRSPGDVEGSKSFLAILTVVGGRFGHESDAFLKCRKISKARTHLGI